MAEFSLVPDAPAPDDDRLINPKAITKLIRRRWKPIVLAAIAALVAATLLYLSAEPQYVATGRLALDRRTDQLVDTSIDSGATNSSVVDTEVQVLRSPEIAAAVVDRLNLETVPGFGYAQDATEAVPSRERAVRVVQSGLNAGREGESLAISVSFAGSDPMRAAQVVNAAMEAYTSGQKTSEYAQRAQEVVLLRDRLGLLRADVIRAEQALAQHRASTNLIDMADDTGAAQAVMQSLNEQLAQARADEAAASARASAAASAATINAPSINSMRSEQARLEAKRAELSERYTSDHPSLVSVNEQLGAVNRSLNSELSRVRQSAIAEAQAARNRAASLRQSVNREQGQLMAANNMSAQMSELERNAGAARTLYQGLLDEYKKKMVALGTERSRAYVIAQAFPPSAPASPNGMAYLIGGLLAALAFGAFAGVAIDNMEGGLLNQMMAEKKLGIPIFASVPDIGKVRDSPLKDGTPASIADHMLAHPDGVFAESFRSIATALKLGQERQLARALAVTSALVDEGKTTTAICLARSACAAGLRVMLVDCDVRHRSATEALAPHSTHGLLDVLDDSSQLDDVIIVDEATGLHMLPSGQTEENRAELVSSRSMRFLLARLRGNYDLVILETAPVLPIAETRALAAMADGTLMIMRWRKTPTDVAKRALDQLRRAGADILGGVLTRVNIHSSIVASAGEDVYYYPTTRPKAA